MSQHVHEISWSWKKFEDLSSHEQYAIHQLRQQVFIVEQKCPFLDADGLDFHSWHLFGKMDEEIVAYLRVIPSNNKVKIGRVVTAPKVRKRGIGKKLIEIALIKITNTFGETSIAMGAQEYLEKFYERFGFKRQGNTYDEDGIPHIEMVYFDR